MNRITSLALAAMLTPALALGISTAVADEWDSDDESGMTYDDDQSTDRSDAMSEGRDGDRDRHAGQQPGTPGDDDQDRQAGSDDQPGMTDDQDQDRTAMGADDEQEDHITSKPQDGYSADDLIGQDVKGRDGDDSVGTVNDLVIDSEGKVVAVIIGTGGRLGIGERNVAVRWDRVNLSFDDDEPSLSVDMDEDALENAPEYDESN